MLSDDVIRRLGELNREPLPAAIGDSRATADAIGDASGGDAAYVEAISLAGSAFAPGSFPRPVWSPTFSRVDDAHPRREAESPLSTGILTVTKHCDHRSLPVIDPVEAENASGRHLAYQRRVGDYIDVTSPFERDHDPIGERNGRAPSELARVREAFPHGVLFLDLETCGLGSAMIFLVGVIRLCGDELVVEQLLARSYNEERAILETLWGVAGNATALVTFNGKSFDWPLVQDRTTYHRMDRRTSASLGHCDLLHHARRRWRHVLPNCKLQTLERTFCGRGRVDDIPGHRIPQAYHDFVRTGETHELELILHHNALDLVTLLELTLQLIGSDS